ncbi:glycoside hydrolase family 88 protein [uncultured Prevotella sp.]|uniref:glycoside hydrolase family 88 protein n=1 Tax=uncultured Prevotella sp. TaxID=159272 RepID=UPI0026097C63|nr:glycoside hydrolase family 88 protein [uncultured Prevotella sp.]
MRTIKLCSGGKGISLRHGKQLLRCLPLVGMLFATSSVNATDSPGGEVKFNSGVRYSQWAINSRTNDFYANTTSFGLATYGTDGKKLNDRKDTKDKLDYVPGLVAKSMIEAADYYQAFDWSKPWFLSVKEYGDTYCGRVPNTGGSLDDLNAVKLYIGLYNNTNASSTDKTKYKSAIGLAQEGLMAHNKTYFIKTGTLAGDKVVGGWFHKANYNNQMWLDGAYMGSALLAQIINFNGTSSNIFGSSDNDWNMVAKQMNIVWNMCWNSTDKLLYHAFEANAGTGTSNSHADTWAGLSGKEPYVFHSASYWGRANAWYLMALVDVLEAMNNAGQSNTTNYATLKQHLVDLAAGIAARQDKTTGGWYQVMDKDGSLSVDSYNSNWNGKPKSVSNYIETSATAIFSAAYFKAVRLGLLDSTTQYDYKTIAKNAFEGLVNNFVNTDNGDFHIWGSCRSAGLGGDNTDCEKGGKKFRDGSNAYYLLGYDVPMVKKDENITEGKVLGGFIMAATEYERAYQNQDTKQILFAKDLAPQYDFSTTAGSLDATAYGNGTITYQWYKDNAKVTDATSATFSPKESGNYYCIATANGTNITTSKTNVTVKNSTGGETTTKTVTFPVGKLMTLDSTPTEKGQVDALSTEAITITAGDNIAAGNSSGIKLSNEKYFITIAADKAKITKITAVTTSKSERLTLVPDADYKDNNNSKTWTYDFSTKKPESVKISGGNSSVYISEITVEYESSTPTTPKTDLTAEYATTSVTAVVGDEDINAPELTVTAGETPLVEGVGYSVSYTSGNENVVKKQEDGTLDAVGKGTATIKATITPADGTKYNNKTLTFTINVSARPLKAVFNTNAVSANVDDEPRELPKLTVTVVNMQQQVSDYTATYSSTNEGVATVVGGKLNFVGAGKTTIKVTVTPTDENTFAPCEASFDVSVADNTTTDPTQKAVVYDFNTSVGNTESANANIKVNSDNIMFGTNFKPNESKYITITPNGDGGFKAGDVITLRGNCPKKNSGILIYAALTDAEPQFQSPAFADTEVEYTFTVQKDSPVLYLGRFGGSSTYVTYLNVTRPGTSGNKTRLTAAFARNSDVIINKPDNYIIDLPALTVKAGNADFNEYSVVYSSNDKQVATVDGNSKKITIETPGTVTILATVTPTDANSYEGCTATYTITVKNPTPLVISAMDVMMNATDAKPKQPVIKVYGDDDKLLTLDRDYTLSFTVKPATEGKNANVSVENGTFNVYGKEYNWEDGSSVITVTATPITESIGDTYTNGTLDFLYNVVKGKLTPAFMSNFASGVIKIKQYDSSNKNDKKFRVPLIYNGEDVSEYFKYTYTVKKSDGTIVTSKTTKGNEFTFRPDKEGEFTITVSAEPKTDQDNYADVYKAPTDMSFNVIVSPDFIRPVITFNPESVQMYVGTTEGAPDVTVTDGTKVIAEGDYNLKWVSFSPSYVKVDENTGNLEAVSEGQGSVRITVTGDKLESMTAFLSVYVDDPAVYRAKSTEKYGNQRNMWNQDRTMSVTLGGWMFPNNVDKTTYSDEGLSRDYYWANEATLPKWKMTGFDRFVSGEKNKNARQENGSNAMPNTTMVSTADFQRTGTVKDAMFNVPCSGSYLTFNPKTNGTVSVHIFQNGAFDSGVYRPQRRVFVMDEQGNFVQSTPEIENANGKPTGGLKSIGNYKWDINPKGANTAPAIADVISHFKNIPTDFDMTAKKFQNNIYESNLSKEIVPNAAYDEKVPGSNGWCVLADSPVTYSFKVKAGKTYYLYNFGSKIGFYGYSFEEDATEVDNVTYKDDETNNIVSTPEGHVAKVSINRTFKAGVWSTCVLPFSLNMSQVDAIFGDTYRFGNENGTEILYFDRVDENGKVWFVRHAYNTIVANKPFLIKPTKDVNGINTTECVEYPYVIIEAPEGGKPAAWCAGSGYSWVSGYNNNEMKVGNGDGFIAKDGSFMTYTGSDAPLKGFRGYLKKDSATAAKILSVGVGSNVDSDNTTTLIDNLIIDNDANASYGISDGKVYNINGQVVGNSKSLNTLPSGVYIINGKKYIK